MNVIAILNSISLKSPPALCVGSIVAAYWWRVIRMAQKMRRKTGRAANLIPREKLGKVIRLIWQPVVWIWIVLPLFTAFAARPPFLLRPLLVQIAFQWIAVSIALLAFAATRICWKRMGKSWRMGIDPNELTTLVFTGPYAFVRHPIYALSSLLMVATVVVVPSPLMVTAAVIHLLLLQWEARREEAHLVSIHGAQYDQYRKHVGRFVPRALHGYFTPSIP